MKKLRQGTSFLFLPLQTLSCKSTSEVSKRRAQVAPKATLGHAGEEGPAQAAGDKGGHPAPEHVHHAGEDAERDESELVLLRLPLAVRDGLDGRSFIPATREASREGGCIIVSVRNRHRSWHQRRQDRKYQCTCWCTRNALSQLAPSQLALSQLTCCSKPQPLRQSSRSLPRASRT